MPSLPQPSDPLALATPALRSPNAIRASVAASAGRRRLSWAAPAAMAAVVSLAACGGGSDAPEFNPLQVVPTETAQMHILSGGSGGGGGGGGGGGVVTPPADCVAQITAFSNTAGYGPYGPNVADIRTKFTVKNCTSTAVNWQARLVYHGPFWGGTVFDFPMSCAMPIAARSSQTCQVTERYLLILQTYDVTLEVLDASGAVLATTGASVATPVVPNPNAT